MNISNIFLGLYHVVVPRDLERTTRYCLHKNQELKDVATRLNLPDVVQFANVAQFLSICALDITMLARQVLLPFNSWKHKLHARHLALALFELSDDMPQLFGKSFRDLIQRGPQPDEHIAALNECRNALSVLMEVHTQRLTDVRNVTAAHRDHDATALLKMIDSVDVTRFRDLAQDAMNWCTSALAFVGKVSNDYNQMILRLNKRLENIDSYAPNSQP